MGFNADNIFVNSTDRDALSSSVSCALKGKKWKVAISNPLDGWIQIIESHETTPPDIAQILSESLNCEVVCAQLYETAGEIAWSVFTNGIVIEEVHREDPLDPSQEISDMLSKRHIPFEMRLFREVLIQKQGWILKSAAL